MPGAASAARTSGQAAVSRHVQGVLGGESDPHPFPSFAEALEGEPLPGLSSEARGAEEEGEAVGAGEGETEGVRAGRS